MVDYTQRAVDRGLLRLDCDSGQAAGSSSHLQFAAQNLEDVSPSTTEKPQALVLDPEGEGLQIDWNERSGVGYRAVHG